MTHPFSLPKLVVNLVLLFAAQRTLTGTLTFPALSPTIQKHAPALKFPHGFLPWCFCSFSSSPGLLSLRLYLFTSSAHLELLRRTPSRISKMLCVCLPDSLRVFSVLGRSFASPPGSHILWRLFSFYHL